MPEREVARQIGISHAGLRKLLAGESERPYKSTQRKVWSWLQRIQYSEADPAAAAEAIAENFLRASLRDPNEGDSGINSSHVNGTGIESPEQELLEYFLDNHQQMATLMTTSTQGLSAEDRRKVALALLNAFKRMAIEAGEPIPGFLYDLERKFVAER